MGNADPDGLKIKVVGTPDEQERLRKIIHDFGRSRTGRQIVYDLTRYSSTIEVEAANTIGDAGAHMIGNYPNRYMKVWSPLYGDILPADGQDHQPLISPAKVMMAHELGHAYGFSDPSYGDVPSPGDVIGRVENPYRKELGLPLRHYYASQG